MSLKAVLFDLDGTLLPMEQEAFTKTYFHTLATKMAPYGYTPEALVAGIWEGIRAMVKNDGALTNEEAFWATFCARFGEKARTHEPVLREYYEREFQSVQAACGFAPEAKAAVDYCRARGWQTVLATNPIFPAIATESRIRWAGLSPADFDYYTTYENSRFCKPNPAYYREILEKLSLAPADCLMVGNDVTEDMVAETLGLSVFLVTDDLLNKQERDITSYPRGNRGELLTFLKKQA